MSFKGPDNYSFHSWETGKIPVPGDLVKKQEFKKADTDAPSIAVGLNWLDVSRDKNIRIRAFANNISNHAADVHIATWSDSVVYSAGCTWFRPASTDKDFQIDTFSTEDDDQKTTRHVEFKRPFAKPPTVVVWLNGLDFRNDRNFRITAKATDITTTGFTIHTDTWSDTVLFSAKASWIAYPENKAGITSGTFSTPEGKAQSVNRGRVDFAGAKFQSTPTVLMAFNTLDVNNGRHLRLKLSADTVTKDGMNWNIDTWLDTELYKAGASYIAFDSTIG